MARPAAMATCAALATLVAGVVISGVPAASASADGTERARETRLAYACDNRHLCRQMRSCEEAYYFLRTCGVSSLDRDHDGVPCESICGSH